MATLVTSETTHRADRALSADRPRPRIGIDLQMLRWPEGGLFYFAWNLFNHLGQTDENDELVPVLIGHDRLNEAAHVREFVAASKRQHADYYWDGPLPRLLSSYFQNPHHNPPWAVRQFDRRIALPLWAKLARSQVLQRYFSTGLSRGFAPPALAQLDILHHFNFVTFPLLAPVNVLTLADLTTLRVPHFHTKGTLDWQRSSYAHVHSMDLIITISEHSKRDVMELLHVDESRIRVTPLAAHFQYQPETDPAKTALVRRKYQLDAAPYLLSIGTLEPRKNHCRLIEAFHRYRLRHPADRHHLVLIGAKGWLFEPIFETIRRLELENSVRWLDYVPFEDLPALVNGATAFVYPSLYEGFGLPPLEAMACGTPVVASNVTSLPEVVGDAVILVDPLDVEALAGAIAQVVENTELQSRLRDAGLKRAKLFSWDKTAAQTLAAYADAALLAKKQPPGVPRPHFVESAVRTEVRRWVIEKSIEHAKRLIHPHGW
jgi:glycosyltransferase involved in cell wall biosynthesis